MIPRLYEYNETSFDNYGLCLLSDTISEEVYEERNGQNELTLRYPITGANYDEIAKERIIGVYANDSKNIQGYRIYSITRQLNGIVTVNARHVSSDLSGVPCPVINGTYTPAEAMAVLFAGTNFTGVSDIVTSKPVVQNNVVSVMSMLGGVEGSLLDLFGGEYEFDNFTVKLHSSRGADNGVIVEYGKNLTQLTDVYDVQDVYSSILPYATYSDDDGNEVVVRGTKVSFPSELSMDKTLMVDLTERFPEGVVPTTETLDAYAQSYISDNGIGSTQSNIQVSFIPTWYDNDDEAIALCDTITIKHSALGVDAKAKVIETTYDCLKERFTKITCGKATNNFVRTVANTEQETQASIVNVSGRMAQAISAATKAITGNSGGNIVFNFTPDGKPYEFLIIDTQDINTATNVWRWNMSGLGFSSTGYNGSYETAITADGKINANFILAGTMSADIINGGALKLGTNSANGGVLEVYDESNTLIGQMDKNGLKMYGADGSYVLINNTVGFAGYDRNDNLIYWVNKDEFHQKKAVVEEEITLCAKMRFIPITITNNGTVVNDGIGLVSVAE